VLSYYRFIRNKTKNTLYLNSLTQRGREGGPVCIPRTRRDHRWKNEGWNLSKKTRTSGTIQNVLRRRQKLHIRTRRRRTRQTRSRIGTHDGTHTFGILLGKVCAPSFQLERTIRTPRVRHRHALEKQKDSDGEMAGF
jgi:hypothetical protein